MVEGGDGAVFPLEATPEIGGRTVFSQDFDGDVAIEAGIAGEINLAHAANAERGKWWLWR